MEIEVNLSLRRLKLFNRKSVQGVFPVAIGKQATPTPLGHYHITRKIINPGGILGSRWMELSIPSHDGPYGIHGTTHPWSIGNAVSNGCIRMHNHDAETVFSQISIGTPVIIVNSNSSFNYDFGVPQTNEPLSPNYYIVQPGDTLWRIAARFGVSIDTIIQLNSLSNPNYIYPGQKLILK